MLRKPAQNEEKFKRKVNGLRSTEKPVVIANTTAYKDLTNANHVNSLKESQREGLKSNPFQKNQLHELHNSSNQKGTTKLQEKTGDKPSFNHPKGGLNSPYNEALNVYKNKNKSPLTRIQPHPISPKLSLGFNALKYLLPQQRKKKSFSGASLSFMSKYAHLQKSSVRTPIQEGSTLDLKENQVSQMKSSDVSIENQKPSEEKGISRTGADIVTPQVSDKEGQEQIHITLSRNFERLETRCLFVIPPMITADETKQNSLRVQSTHSSKKNTLEDIDVQIIDFTHIFKRPSQIQILFADSPPGTFFVNRSKKS